MKASGTDNPPLPHKLPGESTRYWAYRCLLENIVLIRLEPGQVLVEQEVSDWLGISRTPVRDALFQLAQERFVTLIPQSRTLVAKIDMDVVEDARYIRRCVEMDVVRKIADVFDEEHLLMVKYIFKRQELAHKKDNMEAVHQLDEQFHRALFEIAGMLRLWKNVNRQNLHFQRVRSLYNIYDGRTDHVVEQHGNMIAALERGDFAHAEKLMGKHLSSEGWDISTLREAHPHYFG